MLAPNLAADPQLHPSAFVAPGVHLVGDVRLHAESSTWYGTIMRGDINHIEVGSRTNIQDGSILHVDDHWPCIVGNSVTVGHGALLHGCTVEDLCLIGMRATVLTGARIGRGSIVAAGAVVLENSVVEPFSLVAGVPAKLVRRLPETVLDARRQQADKYVAIASLYRERLATPPT